MNTTQIKAENAVLHDDNATKTKRIGLAKMVPSDFQIVIQAQATTVLVVANCYWQLTCKRWANLL